jgi:hypothetical protein
MSQRLAKYQKERADAQRRLEAELEHEFPEGSTVAVLLSRHQTRPTTAEVIGHHDSRVTVRLSTINRRGNRTVKRVHWSSVRRA